MNKGLLGKKLGMTRVFRDDGRSVPVTVIEAGPCTVLQIKTPDKDGYCAIQLGFEDKKEKVTAKPQLGAFKAAKVTPKKFIREIRLPNVDELKVGDNIAVDMFESGDAVDITGTSIGKGFQGGVKRWNWAGGKASHGSMHHRRVGSIGSGSSDPSRIYKGQHMPGRLGGERITVQNLEVVKVAKDNNLLLIEGAVPGHKNSYVVIKKAKKRQKAKIPQAVSAKTASKKPLRGKK
jgi:large subunit ribosomal protein L3